MRLGIDLDGVVADFNAGWMKLYNDEFESDLATGLVQQWDHLHELTHFSSMAEFWVWARGIDRPSVFRHLTPFPGSVESLDHLAGEHDIVIITTKPRWAVHDTYHWIADQGIPTNEIHVTMHKWRVDCDVYLEDSPYQLPLLVGKRVTSQVCRFVRPWNGPVAGAHDVESWPEFVDFVENLVRERENPPVPGGSNGEPR